MVNATADADAGALRGRQVEGGRQTRQSRITDKRASSVVSAAVLARPLPPRLGVLSLAAHAGDRLDAAAVMLRCLLTASASESCFSHVSLATSCVSSHQHHCAQQWDRRRAEGADPTSERREASETQERRRRLTLWPLRHRTLAFVTKAPTAHSTVRTLRHESSGVTMGVTAAGAVAATPPPPPSRLRPPSISLPSLPPPPALQTITLQTPSQASAARTIAQHPSLPVAASAAAGAAAADQLRSRLASETGALHTVAEHAPVEGADAMAAAATATAAVPAAPLAPTSYVPSGNGVAVSASPSLGPQAVLPRPPSAAAALRLSPALHGINGIGGGGGGVSSRGRSPSPRRSASVAVASGGSAHAAHAASAHAGGRRPSFSLHESQRAILDWRPYRDRAAEDHRTETILSPELREAQAAVAAKREQQAKMERARFVTQHSSATTSASASAAAASAVASASAAVATTATTSTAAASGAGTSLPVQPRTLTVAESSSGSAAQSATPGSPSALMEGGTGNGSSGGFLRKALPTAHRGSSYDHRADIFGGGPNSPAATATATTTPTTTAQTLAQPTLPSTASQRRKSDFTHARSRSGSRGGNGGGGGGGGKQSLWSSLKSWFSGCWGGEIRMRTGPLPLASALACLCGSSAPKPRPRRDAAGFRQVRARQAGSQARGAPWGSRRLYELLEHSLAYTILSICLTVFSLFAFDFSVAFLPKVLDDSVAALLLACMCFFGLEILANAYAKQNYFGTSFLFWLDLVGTFSLCFDIACINDAFFPSSSSSSFSSSSSASSSTADGTHGGQVARSASVLRLTKFARVLRILKLVRIVRVFKFNAALQKTMVGARSATPSKVGLTLSELQDKKVIGQRNTNNANTHTHTHTHTHSNDSCCIARPCSPSSAAV